jgi:hypothetical protein
MFPRTWSARLTSENRMPESKHPMGGLAAHGVVDQAGGSVYLIQPFSL